MAFEIKHGDCLEVMRGMADNSVDAIVTDPPYGLSFMGKKWDYDVPGEDVWRECLRVLKPGGHLLAFAGTRTQHRMAVRIEDAGFEIRDMIAWVYGSGFPKSLDVSKAIDKAAGATREVVGPNPHSSPGRAPGVMGMSGDNRRPLMEARMVEAGIDKTPITAPATPDAARWQGWGTALKPSLEPITVARKPLVGTVAENVLEHGTGALNIDGCRVEASEGRPLILSRSEDSTGILGNGLNGSSHGGTTTQGRWPANLIHDGSEEVVGLFPADRPSRGGAHFNRNGFAPAEVTNRELGYGDTGSAARFFYCAKASKSDRDEGLEHLPEQECGMMEDDNYAIKTGSGKLRNTKRANIHPTVKPTDLMRYLCRLVTTPGGTVLDPFCGSGSTGKAAKLEGFNFIGIEREAEYVAIAEARIAEAQRSLGLFA